MKVARFLIAAAMLLGVTRAASAQTATQTVTFSVTDVNTVSVSGNPAAMSVGAGGSASTATDATTTYGVATNSTVAKKITGHISAAMPTGTTLKVGLQDPDGAGAAVALTAPTLTGTTTLAAHDLVTGIVTLDTNLKTVTYTLAATASAVAGASQSRVVTFTIQ